MRFLESPAVQPKEVADKLASIDTGYRDPHLFLGALGRFEMGILVAGGRGRSRRRGRNPGGRWRREAHLAREKSARYLRRQRRNAEARSHRR
jgi:hypothetical protein